MPNRSGNDGTITRFGWKAQNKSLAIFAGEAYNVEMGVTNDVFPTARDETPACNQGINEPNDITRTDTNDVRNQASIIRCTSCRLAGIRDLHAAAGAARSRCRSRRAPGAGSNCSAPASTIRESAAFYATRPRW